MSAARRKPARKAAARTSAGRGAPARKPATAKTATVKAATVKSGRGKAAPSRGGGRRAWLVKSEPESYSIDDLQRDEVTPWTGVRNYQARNTLRDAMAVGDPVLFYHSSTDPMAIVGLAEVASAPRPDPTAFDRNDDHYDPDSRREEPTWFLVDLRHVETFPVPLTRELLAAEPALRGMELLRRGSRLSVQPVTEAELKAVLALARRAPRGGRA